MAPSGRIALLICLSIGASAAETTVWRLGAIDSSAHEFAAAPNESAALPVVVRMGQGNEEKQWPGFQPGSANGRTGAKPYPYAIVFNLDRAPAGVFLLDLALLYRQPRTPAIQVEVNGRRGTYFFDPRISGELGGENDQFNAIVSTARRKVEIPARFFQQGENRITLTAIDEPAAVTSSSSVAGQGDSGVFYDALSLTNDPSAAPAQQLEAAFEPTIFYAADGSEECRVTLRYPSGWPGGEVRIEAGPYASTLPAPGGDLGEARFTVSIPESAGPHVARVEVRSRGQSRPQFFSLPFTPGRKWKLYYAPHEHLDIGYTDYRAKVAEVFGANIDRLLDAFAADPTYRFNFDASWVVKEWLASRTASEAQRFAENARAGRIGMSGFYAGLVTGYPSFEELTRALYDCQAIHSSLGVPLDFAQVTDIPSNSWSIPSVLASAGIRYFADGGNQDRGPLLAYGHWNAPSPFWWVGPDGQRVLMFQSRHYHQLKAVFGLPPNIEAGSQALPRFLETYSRADYRPDAVLLYGTEVENLPMDYSDGAFVQAWNRKYAYPRIEICRFADYFRYIEERYAADLPVVRGGSGDYWADNEAAFAEATARDRGNQSRALSAEKLSAFTAALNPRLRFPLDLDREIWRDLLLFAEHTYSSSRSGGQPEHDEVLTELAEKANQTLRPQSAIDKLMRRSLSQLANLIPAEGRNLVVYNPLNWSRTGLVRCQLDRGFTLTDLAAGRPVEVETLDDRGAYRTVRFLAADVPALGYKVFHMERGTGAAAQPAAAGVTLENRFYRVTLDPARGAIRGIFDKQLSRELVDSAGPYRLNEYLFVTGGGTNTRQAQPWEYLPPAELTVNHARDGKLISVERTPWGVVARMEAAAEHTPRIVTEIRLPDDARRIEIDNRMTVDLLLTRMAAYFAFPWAARQPTFRFDIANGWFDPAKDLMEGGGSEWFNAQHWVNVEDADAAMGLATASAPLVALGDIVRGRWPRRFAPASSAVFSYALTNYWSSKWAGRKTGEFAYAYAITSAPKFDPGQMMRFGYEQRNPLEVSEIKASDRLPDQKGPLPPDQASLAALAPESLMLTAAKGAEDGAGIVFRVMEIAGKDAEAKLTLPWSEIRSAHEANSLEIAGAALPHDAHTVSFHIGPHEVRTIRIE